MDDDWLNKQLGLGDFSKNTVEAEKRQTFANSESKTDIFAKKMAHFDLDKNTAFSGNKYGLYDNLMDDFDQN